MPNNIVAASSITILDLLDTATYIYYAEDENGGGANSAPTADSKYIGIYSGPSLSKRPNEPDPSWTTDVWSGWQKYIGPQGDTGPGIKLTTIWYQYTDENVQPDQPTNSSNDPWKKSISEASTGKTIEGMYLWTCVQTEYSGGLPTTYSYSVSYVGVDATSYYIQTNCETVIEFTTKSGREISPSKISFEVYNFPYTLGSDSISIQKGECILEYIKDDKVHTVRGTKIDNNQFIFENLTEYTPRGYFKFAYGARKDGEFVEVANKIIPFDYGTSEDLASFNVTATAITASVKNSTMKFEEEGLSIYGAGFAIYPSSFTKIEEPVVGETYYVSDGQDEYELAVCEENDQRTFYQKNQNQFTSQANFYADDLGNLTIKGKIDAQAGGTIGGFDINENSLTSNVEGGGEPSIVLNGKEGSIYANDITLGTSAKIKDYLQLGDTAYLYNPTYQGSSVSREGGLVLQTWSDREPSDDWWDGFNERSTSIKIYDNGRAKFGDIKIDGPNSKIYCDSYTSGNWSITPEVASFKNIVASGSIETAVFKQGSVQAAGGAMLFMPSYKIEKIGGRSIGDTNTNGSAISSRELLLDEGFQGSAGDTVWIVYEGSNHYEQKTISAKSDRMVTLNEEVSSYITESNNKVFISSLLLVGKPGTDSEDPNTPAIIGINSNLAETAMGYLLGSGLTITEFGRDKETPHLFLGKLNRLNMGLSGYGLYSDNVYLRGSLTTQSSTDNTYAGVNTASEVQSDKGGSIVFWAGASGSGNIAGAPFYVTSTGLVYAQKAIFKESIFSDGIIEGATIKAAEIHGSGEGKNPALTIYDTAGGISFRRKDNLMETLLIKDVGLFASGNRQIIKVDENSTEIQSNIIKTNSQNFISLQEKDGCPALYHEQSPSQGCGFYFEDNQTSFKMNGEAKLSMSQTGTKFLGNVSFSTAMGEDKFQYKPAQGGYNLYIREG